MLSSLVVVCALAAAPSPSKPVEKRVEAPAGPPFETVIPERALEDFLAAAMPLRKLVTQDLEVLGFSQKVNLDVTLSHPHVRVTPAGIGVTLDFHVEGPGGLA